MLNGSARVDGNTNRALVEIGETLKKEGIDYEIFQLGGKVVRDCIGCESCKKSNDGCIFTDDALKDFISKAKEADGFIFGSPVYYAHPNGRILSILDRAFYSDSNVFKYKPAASVAVARRGGTVATVDVLNKYFGISQMPVAGSTYWNIAHGAKPLEIEQDEEGLCTMRNLAKNLAWLMKSIACAKGNGILPPQEIERQFTNFIR